jgi:spore germination protein YaaH
MYFKVALLLSGLFFFSGCTNSMAPKPKNPNVQNKNLGVEVVEEVTEQSVQSVPIVVREPVRRVRHHTTTTAKTVTREVTKKRATKVAEVKKKTASTVKAKAKAEKAKVKNVVKKSSSTPVRERKKKKTTLKPEPFSLESHQNDPELLGPQSTLDEPL